MPEPKAVLHLPVNTLALRRGGLVKAVMIRANALVNAGFDIVIEILAFQPRLLEDVADLVAGGHLDARVHVRSVLQCLDPSLEPVTDEDPIRGCVHTRGITGTVLAPSVHPDPWASVLVRYPSESDQTLQRVETTSDTGLLRYVDLLTPDGARVLREEYGTGDVVVRVLTFRSGKGLPLTHRWIGRDRNTFLTVWREPHDRNWGVGFAMVGRQFMAFENPAALYSATFEHLLKDEYNAVLFSEFRDQLPNLPDQGFDAIVSSLRHPRLRRVAVVHSNHALIGEGAPPVRCSPNFTALLRGLSRWDLVVAATEHQRDDIVAQFGNADRVRAISHHAPEQPSQTAERAAAADRHRFLLVARIHPKKRVDEAVRAFRLVVDAIPQARLEVFGFGYGDAHEAAVTALVKDLGLDQHIHFNGFINDTADIYVDACATLQTSISEGFGMAILESLAHGIPVVAYDVRYGTRDAIRHGVDGYVVPWGDRQEFAARLVQLSHDRNLRARLGENARTGVIAFSRERYEAGWREAMDGLPITTAEVRRGALELVVPRSTVGAIILRKRDRSTEIEAVINDGHVRIALPAAARGDIFDVSMSTGGWEVRVGELIGGVSDDAAWRVYATQHGNLSLRSMQGQPHGVSGSTSSTSASSAPNHPGVARRALRRLRRED